jgi:hypothetical protein
LQAYASAVARADVKNVDCARTRLLLFPEPSDENRYVLTRGEYDATIVVTARDTNARSFDLSLKVITDAWPLEADQAPVTLTVGTHHGQ